jgi:hypothetical protein
MRIAFISSDWSTSFLDENGYPTPGGAGWYRCRIIADALRERGHDVVHCPNVGNNTKTGEIHPRTWDGEYLSGYEVLIFQRWMTEQAAEVIKAGQRFGQVCINDVDDWFDGISATNGAFSATHPRLNVMNRQQARQSHNQSVTPSNRNFYRHGLAASSLLTVSTPYLADRYAKLGVKIVVLRNAIDLDRWKPIRPPDKPTIGWVGATTHRSSDLQVLHGVLGPFVEAKDLRFIHSGTARGSPSAANMLGIPESIVRTRQQTSILEYPDLFAGIGIGVAPLSDISFNYAKSAIKVMEYSASGIPFVASDLPEYAWYKAGLVAKRPKDWLRSLSSLMDPSYRRDVALQARQRVEAEDIRNRICDWESVYSACLHL